VATAVAFVAAVGPAAAAPAPRQYGSMAFTSTVPAASTGTVLDFHFVNPSDPNAKPYAVKTMVVHGPRGTVVDTSVPPQCHATDAEIYLEGPAACPADSQIGSGFAESDQGDSGGLSPRYSRTTLTHFNNQGEVVGIGVYDGIPVIKTIDRTNLQGTKSTSNFPLFPGFPPPEPYTPVSSLYVKFPPYQRNGRAYHVTPATCPAAGYWTFKVDFNYRDGVTQSVTSHSPCQR
jgi:hypothetical protein